MKLPIYFISDNHFLLENSKLELERRLKLFQLFCEIQKTGGTLVIGGDFFDYWLESFGGIPSYYNDILNELEKLKQNHITIHYVVGNHDYWDFGFLNKKCGAIIHKKDFLFKINNQKILVTHGDGLLKNDYLYRFTKKIIRSNLFILLARLIPSSIMTIIARKISGTKLKFGKLQNLPEKYKQELEKYAINQINDYNVNTVLMGHYHQLGIKKINHENFIHLGDWINQYTVTVLDKNQTWHQKKMAH